MLAERLVELRKKRDITQDDVAKVLDITRPAYTAYENNRRQPDYDTLNKIADYYNVSIDYLLGRTSIANNSPSSYISAHESLSPYVLKTHSTKIPVLGTIRAGLPILAEDNWEETIEIPDYLNADYALRVIGDSMSWIGIHEGDLALMEQTSVASHGSIVAAGVEDGEWKATLKFFVQENGGFKLRAANPEYGDMLFTPQHRIIGRLLRIIKEPPTLHDYKDMVISKEVSDIDWQDTIMKSVQNGLDGKKVQNMIDLFADVAKKVK